MSRGHLLTEQANPLSQNLDQLSPLEIVDLFNQEDAKAVAAVAAQRKNIAEAIAMITASMANGGRLFYVGAGTSGRLGVLDAAECPPTFCTNPELVQGIIAGGNAALVRSSEALEDRESDGAMAISDRGITNHDVVFGITAGGTTPYVHGALKQAQTLGAKTIFFACVPAAQVPTSYDLEIRPLVGAEILCGSTRLKAGTATKLVLNTISTAVMVGLGKVYGNRMVDVSVTNSKLRDRATRILMDLAALDQPTAANLLEQAKLSVKTALFMHWTGLDLAVSEQYLAQHDGHLADALSAFRDQ
ncbi:N-acetylmuramic acid 6-phosphate etherase [Thalassoporum mexicanum PCC 7367]|uniref:N-acetylmuramic acid 6-phosphate etherase n=1 Tax=Thalassoporum mexicanum TaxID=3457544 RepID=UPI00029FE15C|nr:N-acetylmuramic acid 6-phosphate etherase [Pseudanabaena sp. PCC 7367]AFY69440.1 N-acetylmuramic acid 6-phosphate etherase [Pseudanabaena sp. PCC 7367]